MERTRSSRRHRQQIQRRGLSNQHSDHRDRASGRFGHDAHLQEVPGPDLQRRRLASEDGKNPHLGRTRRRLAQHDLADGDKSPQADRIDQRGLLKEVAATPGSIGYANLGDARNAANGGFTGQSPRDSGPSGRQQEDQQRLKVTGSTRTHPPTGTSRRWPRPTARRRSQQRFVGLPAAERLSAVERSDDGTRLEDVLAVRPDL